MQSDQKIHIQRVMVEVEKYEYNGVSYDTLRDAERAEEKDREQNDPIYRFSKTSQGAALLKEHRLDDVGYFGVYDEGPVDYGSSGSPRLLKVAHGKLRNVIHDAFKTKGFVGWGPGYIRWLAVEEV